MLKAKLSLLSLPAIGAKAALAAYSFLFPAGSAASIVESSAVTITPVRHWNNQWAWWCVKHTDLAGQQPSFLVPKAGHFNLVANERLAVWATAADSDVWTDFTAVTIGATNIEFQHGSAFTNKKIYIASLPMYPFSRTQRLVGVWDADSRVSDTPSSANYILGYATARSADDGSGRTAPALPFYGLKITNPSGNTKNKAILVSGNHPSETTGRFALEGAIAWLLGGSALAEFLLDYFEFYIYPCVNPQGVWAGYFRSCPQDKTLDHNRQWNTTGTLECIDAIKAAMLADTGGAIEAGIDYHSSADDDTVYGFTYDNTEALHVVFSAKMVALEASFDMRNLSDVGTLHKLWRDDYAARLFAVTEQGGLNTRTITQIKNSGAYSLQSLANILAEGRWTHGPGVGSRDFNGATDRIDWSNIANLSGSPLTISAWVKWDGQNAGNNSYILCIHDSGDLQYGIVLNIITGVPGDIDFVRHGTTDYLWYRNAGTQIPTGSWVNVIVTSDGGLLSNSVVFYINGGTVTQAFSNGTGSETAHTGSWSLGGRIYSDNRNLDGKIAQVGIWNRVLTAGEIANLAAGQAPDLAAASGLQFYFKGNSSSLVAAPGGAGTADGTTQLTGVGNGPSIIY